MEDEQNQAVLKDMYLVTYKLVSQMEDKEIAQNVVISIATQLKAASAEAKSL